MPVVHTPICCFIQGIKSTCLLCIHRIRGFSLLSQPEDKINMHVVHTQDQDFSLLSNPGDQINMPMVLLPWVDQHAFGAYTRPRLQFVVLFRGPNQHAYGAYTSLLSHPEDQINTLVVHTQDQEPCCLIQRTESTCLWCIHRTKNFVVSSRGPNQHAFGAYTGPRPQFVVSSRGPNQHACGIYTGARTSVCCLIQRTKD